MALVIKKMRGSLDEEQKKFELLRTIRAGESFSELN